MRRREGATIDVHIRVDRENLGSIIVLLPRTGEPLRVPCRSQEYAEGLSEWQHELCKKYAKNHRQPGSPGNTVEDWRIAFADICRASLEMLEERSGKRKKSQGLANARWVQCMDTMLLNADEDLAAAARPKLLTTVAPLAARSAPPFSAPVPAATATSLCDPSVLSTNALTPKAPFRGANPKRRPAPADAPSRRPEAVVPTATEEADSDEDFVPKYMAIIKSSKQGNDFS